MSVGARGDVAGPRSARDVDGAAGSAGKGGRGSRLPETLAFSGCEVFSWAWAKTELQ